MTFNVALSPPVDTSQHQLSSRTMQMRRKALQADARGVVRARVGGTLHILTFPVWFHIPNKMAGRRASAISCTHRTWTRTKTWTKNPDSGLVRSIFTWLTGALTEKCGKGKKLICLIYIFTKKPKAKTLYISKFRKFTFSKSSLLRKIIFIPVLMY